MAEEKNIPIILEIFKQSNIIKALLVHSTDGLDEISPAAKSTVYEYNKGSQIKKYSLEPNWHKKHLACLYLTRKLSWNNNLSNLNQLII